jgi:hypothetical protein
MHLHRPLPFRMSPFSIFEFENPLLDFYRSSLLFSGYDEWHRHCMWDLPFQRAPRRIQEQCASIDRRSLFRIFMFNIRIFVGSKKDIFKKKLRPENQKHPEFDPFENDLFTKSLTPHEYDMNVLSNRSSLSTMMWVTKHNYCCSSPVVSMGLIATLAFSLFRPPALVNGFSGHIPAVLGRTTAATWISSTHLSANNNSFSSYISDMASSFLGKKVSSQPELDKTLSDLSLPTWPDIRSLLESQMQTDQERSFRQNIEKGYGIASPMNKVRLFDESNKEEDIRVTFYRDSASWCPYCQVSPDQPTVESDRRAVHLIRSNDALTSSSIVRKFG